MGKSLALFHIMGKILAYFMKKKRGQFHGLDVTYIQPDLVSYINNLESCICESCNLDQLYVLVSSALPTAHCVMTCTVLKAT